jgi:tetratricopeptide (TPR) repeat protein
VFVVVWFVAGSPASADPDDADDRNHATQLFEQGRKRKDAGDVIGACESFEASYKLEPAPGTALNVGACAERAREWYRAWELYDTAATIFLRLSDNRARFARSRADAVLEAHREDVEAGPPEIVALPEGAAPVYVTRQQDWRRGLKVVGGVSLGLSALGALLWIQANQQINAYRDGAAVALNGVPLDAPEHCGQFAVAQNPVDRERFDEACAASDRKAVIVPLTVVTAVIGAGALIAVLSTKPERVRVVPHVSPHGAGISAELHW